MLQAKNKKSPKRTVTVSPKTPNKNTARPLSAKPKATTPSKPKHPKTREQTGKSVTIASVPAALYVLKILLEKLKENNYNSQLEDEMPMKRTRSMVKKRGY